MQLIKDWRLRWKFWSVRLQALGAALLTFSLAAPDYAIQAIAILPAELRAGIDPEHIQYLALASVIAGTAAQFIRQQKLDAERRRLETERERLTQEQLDASAHG